MVRQVAVPADVPDGETVILEEQLEKLAFPADLVAKTVAVDFQWRPKISATYHLEAFVRCGNGAPEIYFGNNSVGKQVAVAAP